MEAPAEAAVRLPTLAEVEAAAARIAGVSRRTPLERCGWLSELAAADVYLKLECWQPTRSFKVRGASHAVLGLDASARARGVVAASAGNHGQAVALAARHAGTAARIFVPRSAPAVKKDRIRSLGAELDDSAADYDAAEDAAAAHARRTGATLVHAYSDFTVVCGQATVALEIRSALPDVATVLVPVGGGGLVAGVGAVLRAHGSARAVGVQSERTRNMYEAFAAGAVVPCPIEPTLADGLAGCTDTPAYLRARAVTDELHLVTETAIAEALRAHLARDGLLLEGSAAVCTAALLDGQIALRGPTVLVLTGGNIDPATLSALLS